MASTDWVERPREAPAVRLKLDQAADRGRRVAHLNGAGARILRDVDLTLHGGERVAITGANGAGKTTLLQLLLGTLPPAQGEVHTATTVRLLPQTFHATGSVMHQFSGIEESEARTLLAHFGLDTDAIRRPLERLSPGQRARAAIAALVASQADLLLLDEPTNHLDFDTLEVLETALAHEPEHDRRRLPRPLVPGRDRRHAAAPRRGWRRLRAMLGRHGHLPGYGRGRFPGVSSLR